MSVIEQDTQEIDVTTDSDEGVCDKDINFVLRGFVVSGVVRSGEAPGPDNFRLALYNAKDGTLITSTVTEEGGRYEFKTKPGILRSTLKLIFFKLKEATKFLPRVEVRSVLIKEKFMLMWKIRRLK